MHRIVCSLIAMLICSSHALAIDVSAPPPVKDYTPSPNSSAEKKPLKLVPLSEVINRPPPPQAQMTVGNTPAPGASAATNVPAAPLNAKPVNPTIQAAEPLPPVKPRGRFIDVQELPPVTGQPGEEPFNPEDMVDPNSVAADENFVPASLNQATFRGIRKLTGRSEALSGTIGDVLRLGRLEITLHKCSSVIDQGEKGYAALIEVDEQTPSGGEESTFRGWLFSTTPSLSSLAHPEYDLLLLSCGT